MAQLPPDDPNLNPFHLYRFPRGWQRDEENRRRSDELAAKLAEDNQAGAINTDTLKPENEILQHMDPRTGNWPVTNLQPGFHYVGLHKDNITISRERARGFEAVQGEDPEAKEFQGQDAAGASSLRGLGDVLLYRMPQELWDRWENEGLRKAIGCGAIELDEGPESAWADDVNDPNSAAHRLGARAHGRYSDPRLRQTIFRGSAGQIERLQRGLKNGDIPNFEQAVRG